jgi:DASH complex subunit DAD3
MDDDTLQAEPGSSILHLAGDGLTGVTPLEQEVLDEYERLLRNMNQASSAIWFASVTAWSCCWSTQADFGPQLSSTLATLSSGPITIEVAEGLRLLERKVASVYTLLKASVYSIVLQQGQIDGDGETISAAGSRSEDG